MIPKNILMVFDLSPVQIKAKKANKKYEPMQKGDVKETFSDSTKIKSLTGYDHYKSLDYGITKFVK